MAEVELALAALLEAQAALAQARDRVQAAVLALVAARAANNDPLEA